MPVWWAWLIIILVVAVATAIVVWLLARKSATRQLLNREGLAKVQAEGLRAELAAEQRAASEIKKHALQLDQQLRATQAWYDRARKTLTKEVQDEYERLASDPDALAAKLDELLANGEGPSGEG